MKNIYKIFSVGFLILFCISSATFSQDSIPQKAEEIINKKVDNGPLISVAVGYVLPEGETSFYTKGTLTNQRQTTVDKNTIFETGSVTKIFSALAISQLITKKGFSLDTKAEKLLPNGFDLPEYEGQPITLRHLVTHTSGLPRLPGNLSIEDESNPYAHYDVSKLKAFLSKYELPREPGEQFEYSNLGMGLAGHILEHQYDASYEQVIRKQILEPLDMQHTGVNVNTQNHSIAQGHRAGEEVPHWDFASVKAAGALKSNAADMTSFLSAQLGLIDTSLKTSIQKSQAPLFNISEDRGNNQDKISMGWMLSTQADSILWHNGSTGGFHSFMGINLEKQTGVVILSNSNESIDDIGFYILDQDHQLAEFISLTSEQLEQYVGEYQADNGASFHVTQNNNQLYVQLTGQNKLPVYPQKDNTFIYKAVDAKIKFSSNRGEHPDELTLYQNGREISAEKVED